MRIAQIAPLHEAVPPALYGGTERVVSLLTEELVALGHDVTLFGSGNSRTSAALAHSRCRSSPRYVTHRRARSRSRFARRYICRLIILSFVM